MIRLSQRPLSDNIQYWKQTDICKPNRIWTHNSNKWAASNQRIRHQQIEVVRTRKFCCSLRTERQFARLPTHFPTLTNSYIEITNAPRSRSLKLMYFKFTGEVKYVLRYEFAFVYNGIERANWCMYSFYVWASVHHKSILRVYKEPTRCNFGSTVY